MSIMEQTFLGQVVIIVGETYSYYLCVVACFLPPVSVKLDRVSFTSTFIFIPHSISFFFAVLLFRICVYYVICVARGEFY